ncbi:hypothetical protein PUMCH_000040 [Australozyma saopauloensis]|uniref:Monocarboxylate transporter n=1 Tax=Australozyma saopauloensis TaxID=291208 RepID=A0AAX4H3Q3_9ASCO|nr:hypothetical protein PUMCH_000040 [[Candida] saopauloensis]
MIQSDRSSSESREASIKETSDPSMTCQPAKEATDIEKEPVLNKSPGIADIPDGGYGWFIVLSSFLFNFATWGANSGFAVYLSHYLNEQTFPGADKYDYALIGGLTFGGGLLFSPFINWLQGKIGARPTAGAGVVFQFASLLLASFVTKLWQLYLTQGLLQAFGLAFMTIPALLILPQWFKHKRAFAVAIAAAGSGCGGVVFNLAMQKVMQVRSVHWALRVQAILCVVSSTCATLLLRTRMEVKYTIWDASVVKSGAFLLCILYLIFCMFGYVIVLYTMANVTTSMGYSPYQGSIASAMIQVGSVFGRPIVGKASDRFGPVTVASVAYFLSGVFVFAMWIPAKNYATIIAFCLIMGAIMGTIFATFPSINTKLYGLHRASVGLSLSWPFMAGAGIASPVIGLTLKTGNNGFVGSGQYTDCAIFAGASFMACTCMLLLIRGYIIFRNEVSDTDTDEGHLHIKVPIWEPFRYALAIRDKV